MTTIRKRTLSYLFGLFEWTFFIGFDMFDVNVDFFVGCFSKCLLILWIVKFGFPGNFYRCMISDITKDVVQGYCIAKPCYFKPTVCLMFDDFLLSWSSEQCLHICGVAHGQGARL